MRWRLVRPALLAWAMSNRSFTIERARDDEATFAEALDMSAKQHRQGALAPMNPDKVARVVFEVMADNLMIFARDPAGKAIGMLPLSREEIFYSDVTYFQNIGLWIEPEWRKTGVLRGLLKEAAREADKHDTFVLITISDPDRRKRPADPEAQTIGYVSVGYTLKLQGKSKSHGR